MLAVKQKEKKGYEEVAAIATKKLVPKKVDIKKVIKKKAAPAKKATPKKKKGGADESSFFTRGVCATDTKAGGKFWQIDVKGTSFTTTFGKLGDGGSTSSKDFDDAETAMKEAQKLVKQKEKKGYAFE